jgi:hypothetical protein
MAGGAYPNRLSCVIFAGDKAPSPVGNVTRVTRPIDNLYKKSVVTPGRRGDLDAALLELNLLAW